MIKPHEKWKVLPHGHLTEIDVGLLSVVGELEMPLKKPPRRMNEPQMAAIEALDRPAFLVVPNDHHRLDAKICKARYPRIEVVAPVGARDKFAETVVVNTKSPALLDSHVELVTVPSTKEKELALIVRRPSGTTLVLDDLVGNVQGSSGFGKWLLRTMGFAGDETQIPAPLKLSLVKDKDTLRTQLSPWAEMRGRRRILVAYGDPIESNPRQLLHDLASSLG